MDKEKAEELLNTLLKERGEYFDDDKATTRHEAWFLASALSNIILIQEIRELKEVLGGKEEQPRIFPKRYEKRG